MRPDPPPSQQPISRSPSEKTMDSVPRLEVRSYFAFSQTSSSVTSPSADVLELPGVPSSGEATPPHILGRMAPCLRWALRNSRYCSRRLMQVTVCRLNAEDATKAVHPALLDIGVRLDYQDKNRLLSYLRVGSTSPIILSEETEPVHWLRVGDTIVVGNCVTLQLGVLLLQYDEGVPQHDGTPSVFSRWTGVCSLPATRIPTSLSWGRLSRHRRQALLRAAYQHSRLLVQSTTLSTTAHVTPNTPGEEILVASSPPHNGGSCHAPSVRDSGQTSEAAGGAAAECMEAATPSSSQRHAPFRKQAVSGLMTTAASYVNRAAFDSTGTVGSDTERKTAAEPSHQPSEAPARSNQNSWDCNFSGFESQEFERRHETCSGHDIAEALTYSPPTTSGKAHHLPLLRTSSPPIETCDEKLDDALAALEHRSHLLGNMQLQATRQDQVLLGAESCTPTTDTRRSVSTGKGKGKRTPRSGAKRPASRRGLNRAGDLQKMRVSLRRPPVQPPSLESQEVFFRH